MPEQALQIAFEIKSACDEISRRLLHWHWEQKPGAHSLESLLQHLEERRAESPDYYDRLPDLSGKTGWQQLDTTLCMRVLLDPEKDASRPLDLLGNTAHPAAARRACNAVRTARNEAAHAADSAGAAQAALLFSEAVEALEDGYANSAFTEYELAQFYRKAEDFLSRLREANTQSGKQSQSAGAPRSEPQSAKAAQTKAETPQPKAGQAKAAASKQEADAEPLDVPAPMRRKRAAAEAPAPAKKPRASGTRSGNGRSSGSRGSSSAKKNGKNASTRGKNKKRADEHSSRALWVVLIVAAVIGLVLRAKAMGA